MASAASSPRILLIEGDDGDALLVQECLGEAGFARESLLWRRTLSDGQDALAARPRCVLLDLGLPDADGLSALTKLVDASPDTPVIVLTGRHGHAGTDALAAGAQDYLVKDDITAGLLGRAVRYAIERKRAEHTSRQLREVRLSVTERARLERGLLPTPLLRTDLVECCTYYRPGRDHAVLGGDFFDVVETTDGRIRAVIGDVMGHGPDEAAIGVHLRVAWRTLVLARTPDTQILPTLAHLLAAETQGNAGFVTACDVTIDAEFGATLRVAGHPAPLICADGQTRYLDVAIGAPLGLERLWSIDTGRPRTGGWPQTSVAMGSGSSLILYTDGLLDAYTHEPDERSLGIQEIIAAVRGCVADGLAVSSWLPAIVDNAPKQSRDDTAVVVLATRAAADSTSGR